MLDEDVETTDRPCIMMVDHSYPFNQAISSYVQAAALEPRDARRRGGGTVPAEINH